MTEELRPSQAASRIGASTRSIQRWIALGRLPARRVGGRLLVASDALDAFMAQSGSARPGSVAPGSVAPARASPDWGPGRAVGAPALPAVRHVFVANRGEIARRIRRTADRLGIRVTVPPTDGPRALDLLDIEAVVATALAAGADAVHPGYGFLAENAEFAAAVEAAGLTWVGPPPAAIRAMGDKAAARRLAANLGVPVVPGYDGDAQDDRSLAEAATEIGVPLLVKPVAGGGGKGMRIVRNAGELAAAIGGARREAAAAFGDDRLILERLVEGPRHVEIQVLFDRYGAGVHLGERDCSIQRRHQKVLEESPSPALDDAVRARLGRRAVALAGAVGYVGAGTCEFLLSDAGAAYFLEMNTRLQVEHPVTELVTGRDLVADQLRIAAGEALGITQPEIDAGRADGGHAVEVRLYAEDAEAGFLPATGRVERLEWPAGTGIRVDAGIDAGDEVGGRFDPMLAKIIARGPDRTAALDRLTDALERTVVLGLTTNLRFLRWLVGTPVVRAGEARIDSLDRVWPPADWAERTEIPERAWQAAGAVLGLDGWRLNGPRRMRLAAEDGEERWVAFGVDGQPVAPDGVATARSADGRTAYVDVDGRSVAMTVAPPPDVDRAARAATAHHATGPTEVVAPMPGGVVAVHVAAGATVEAGDPIATLEAMKMEHLVLAPIAGRVTELQARTGDQVARGQLLAIVEP